jgi:hypothetical protein
VLLALHKAAFGLSKALLAVEKYHTEVGDSFLE